MLGCQKRESVRSGEKVIPMDVFQMSTLVENLRMNISFHFYVTDK